MFLAGTTSQALPEAARSTDDVAANMPHVLPRWNSHELSPRRAEGAEHMLHEEPRMPHHRSTSWRATGYLSNRRQIVDLQVPNDNSARHLTSMGSDDIDDESCDEEIISSDALAQEEEQASHLFEAAVPCLSRSATPSRAVLFGENGEDVQEIANWYFVCQLPAQDYALFQSVENHWVQGMWDMSRHSQTIFSVVGAFALHKKATLWSGQANSEYYKQKGRIIQNIISDMRSSPSGPDSVTVAAMAILAYFDIRDEQHNAASMHLAAVRNFIDMPKMSPQGWLVAAWTDLRQALHGVTEPVLPFYVPIAFREVHETLRLQKPEAFRLGALNALQCPRSSVFTLHMASDLFGKLHALCHCSKVLSPSETPPLGQVYALEYGLRVAQARTKLIKGDIFASPIMLVTSAIQLNVWMAARFYTPQARETHLSLIKIAREAIDSFEDMVTQFYIAAGLESLLWVLFTLISAFRSHGMAQTTKSLGLLYQALRKAGINSCDKFEARLKHWPWIDNWHPGQIDVVWDLLSTEYPDLFPRIARPCFPEAKAEPLISRHRWFVGGFEFHNSLGRS